MLSSYDVANVTRCSYTMYWSDAGRIWPEKKNRKRQPVSNFSGRYQWVCTRPYTPTAILPTLTLSLVDKWETVKSCVAIRVVIIRQGSLFLLCFQSKWIKWNDVSWLFIKSTNKGCVPTALISIRNSLCSRFPVSVPRCVNNSASKQSYEVTYYPTFLERRIFMSCNFFVS